MDYKIKIDDDTVSEIVRKSLEEMIYIKLRNDFEEEGQAEIVLSMLIVHEYYSTKQQHIAFISQIDEEIRELFCLLDTKRYGITNVETTEESDGSLSISFNASDEALKVLASKGIEYAVLSATLGNPTTDQLLEWAMKGKNV